ncbi:SDR family NAD(P)-dependent oxidoreductase [Streptomyces sp. NPDC018029]|uniref:SDR family NAD(P)-dependent oxidoreductase n=1 Tax=Streptomyces sp. NPDC018029 TaxID=3365032 RepID=UPI0037B631F6
MPKYAGRKAVVIGGATGLGLAIAKRLVEGGAEVLVTGGGPHADLADTAAEVGSCAHVISAAPTSPSSSVFSAFSTALASAIQERLGGIDLLFIHADDGLAAPPAPELLDLLREGGSVVLTGGSTDDPAANSLAPLTRCRAPADETAGIALHLATKPPPHTPGPPHPHG